MEFKKTPNLQNVTDVGATTTNNLTLDATTPTITTGTNKKLVLLPNGTGIVEVGDATVAGKLGTPTNDDLHVCGRVEIDGILYVDATSAFSGDATFTTCNLNFVSNGYGIVASGGSSFSLKATTNAGGIYIYDDAGTPNWYGVIRTFVDDGIKFSIGSGDGYANHHLIFTSYDNTGKDHDHDFLSNDPTIYIHSALNPDTDNNRWGSICHSGTAGSAGRFDFRSGNGSIIHLQSGARDGTNFVNIATDMQQALVTGAHDGGNNASALAVSTANWAENIFVGHTLYNVTDASSGTITANNATSITATLGGGTDNDWDTGDVYAIGIRGTHNGSSNVAVLSDSTKSWVVNAYVGYRVYNVTDGSSGLITANSATTVTAGLEGGTDNDWDASDVYVISNAPNGTASGSLFEVRNAGYRKLHIDPRGCIKLENSEYVNYRQFSGQSVSPGSSGATQVPPSASTLGGYQLNAAGEELYWTWDVHGDWDAASDLYVEVTFEKNTAGGAGGDTADLRLQCWYKGSAESANKTQSIAEDAVVVADAAQYTQFKAHFTIDYNAGGNVVDVGDVFGFILNLETDTSECDDIIVNHIECFYRTTQPCVEYSQV